jgi:hypothetical protein
MLDEVTVTIKPWSEAVYGGPEFTLLDIQVKVNDRKYGYRQILHQQAPFESEVGYFLRVAQRELENTLKELDDTPEIVVPGKS